MSEKRAGGSRGVIPNKKNYYSIVEGVKVIVVIEVFYFFILPKNFDLPATVILKTDRVLMYGVELEAPK